jgi:DNA-binding NtrC family response regulator
MNKRILIADDDSAVRESLRKVLEGAGYQVLSAVDGDDAERKFTSEPIDLLLLDLNLPKQNGWNVFGFVSSQNPVLPIVIITGQSNRSDSDLAPGVSAFLEKPIDVPVLLNVIEDLLAEPFERRLRRVTSHFQRKEPTQILGATH